LAKRKTKTRKSDATSANVGYEAQLWQMADALRGSMDAAEYKHVVLGLIFLKYISDAFEEHHARLVAEQAKGADPEDPDEYRALSIFWVPPEARWAHLKAQAKQPTIGRLVDDAMAGIERDNAVLKGVLPKDYARPALDKTRLGQLIDMVSNIQVGDEEARAKDVLGRVYEYFLEKFALAEGRKGGEFLTPHSVVNLLVEMIEPYRGRVYDPCCGSGGMFVQSLKFIRAHANGNGNGNAACGKPKADISIYGQESNYTTWRLAKMNLAIRGIDGQIAHGDTFHADRHPDLKADFILANPPFNISDWGGERLAGDKRWQYGTPPRATPTTPGYSTSSTTWRPPAWPASYSPTARCRQTSPARARSARASSRPTSWTAWSRCRASSSTPRRSRPVCGSSRATARTASSATAAASCSSSTPASSAAWRTAPIAS
jgi:type I restriction enzyme M protein